MLHKIGSKLSSKVGSLTERTSTEEDSEMTPLNLDAGSPSSFPDLNSDVNNFRQHLMDDSVLKKYQGLVDALEEEDLEEILNFILDQLMKIINI